MKNKPYDDSNWKEEYKNFVSDKYKLGLLENGATSISQGWILGTIYSDWKKFKGYEKYDLIQNKGELQSSFKEFESKIKKKN